MIIRIALRNLLHDRVRLAVTLTGVVFAVVLIAVQGGLFVGFTRATSCVIDNTEAEVWVASRGVRNFDVTHPLPDQKFHQVLGIPGVARAERFIVRFANWKKPAGGQESIEVVGFDPASGLGRPWAMTAGSQSALRLPDAVAVDELYLGKLGITGLGDRAEINDRRARVVALTRGIRSFTTSPYVFTSFENGLKYAGFARGQSTYLLVRPVAGLSAETLRDAIAAGVPDVDVFTREEFSGKTQYYWMFTTGAGMALLIAASLGLVVGGVVVAQTLYATTVDHLPEFGTLRAMGAPGGYIHRIIVAQAVAAALVGYAFGIAISYFLVSLAERGGASILLPPGMAVGLFFLTVVMCVTAGLVSIRKVTSIDPAMVFRGA
ncbi:putative ABC transporter, permease protein [Desulfovibrio sp. DV]|uniref:FtsX-like permease family protein n=1 Tax=Desulfovibrio sp. DV TaxID=1844708 RepID=UPI00094B7E97|nr:FtsX-like permease family protein [Desulfovibrio sp. DV]OLN24507.1 putative ABC transporter, permease protein [Desulfovibrio sp. DV]